MTKQFFVYILASRRNGTLYTGMTTDLARRLDQHKSGVVSGFTQRYRVHQLVYFECYDSPEEALRRERNIKAWRRAWKLELIEKFNPNWIDLGQTFV